GRAHASLPALRVELRVWGEYRPGGFGDFPAPAIVGIGLAVRTLDLDAQGRGDRLAEIDGNARARGGRRLDRRVTCQFRCLRLVDVEAEQRNAAVVGSRPDHTADAIGRADGQRRRVVGCDGRALTYGRGPGVAMPGAALVIAAQDLSAATSGAASDGAVRGRPGHAGGVRVSGGASHSRGTVGVHGVRLVI